MSDVSVSETDDGRVNGILFHHEASARDDAPREIGGKARGLARAERAGFAVPPWFVVLPEAFDDIRAAAATTHANADTAASVEAAAATSADAEVAVAADADAVAAASADADAAAAGELTVRAREQLACAAAALCPNGERVAVRSSASDEDGAQHSFAGQLESVLDVAPHDIEARVRDVWRSGFSERILAYRREHGLPPLPRPPAVIVQRMIAARAAGVAFSADPISGRRAIAVVAAVRGLGASLVSGESDADTWRVDRRGTIVERNIHPPPMPPAPHPSPHSKDAPSQPSAAVLTDDEVLAIARLVREVARRFGRPQDIEWALDGDRLWLLQARPITALASRVDPDGALAIWDNSNIVESYSGVTTPLTCSFASDVYAHVYRQFCRLMRVPARAIEAQDDTFRNMLGLVRGRLYYNLPNWYRVLALLPGYRVNRAFMEQMMGVREPLPAEAADRIEQEMAASSRGRVSDAFHLAATVAGLLLNYATLDRRVRAFTRLLDAALAPPDPPLEDRRPDELAAHYRELRRQLLLKWDAPLVNDFFAMIFYGVLRSLVRTWCGDEHGTLQNDLVGGAGGMVSAEPAIRMRRLARLAASAPDPALRELLVSGPLAEIARALSSPANAAFRAEYAAYLDKFGERTVNELKLESATLHDDPLPLLRAIANLARQANTTTPGAAGGATHGDALRVEAQRRVRAALRRHPLRRVVFAWIVRHAQARVRDRENLRLERTRLFGRIRRIMREMGRRLREMEMLDDAQDIFYLEVDEILALVEGRSTCTNVRALAAIRREEFNRYAATDATPPPDDRFETRGLVYHGNTFQRDAAASAAAAVAAAAADDGPGGHAAQREQAAAEPAAEERRGLGCCPGVVRGRVRVVLDPRGVTLDAQTILVAQHTDPGWILIFPSASGLLVERGSLLSHAAIVARELGIPAVVSLPGLTRWLHDGDVVEIDGSSGLVRRLAAAAADAAAEDAPASSAPAAAREEATRAE